MLNPVAFANSLAVVSGLFFLALYILAVVWRDAFRFVFNAQFLGADVASLLPHKLPATGFLATLIALVISAWSLGFCWAWLYNRLVG
jgi:2TM family of unknown function (DUF5676)